MWDAGSCMRSQRLVFLAAVSTAAISLLAVFAAQAAAPVITDTALVPRFTIQSDLGVTNQIQYSTSLSETNWVVLTNLVVTESPYWFVDVDAPTALYVPDMHGSAGADPPAQNEPAGHRTPLVAQDAGQ